MSTKIQTGPWFLSGKKLYWVYFLALIGMSVMVIPTAVAQRSGEAWSQPFNLSHSGSATNPLLVVDSGGVTHVIWSDTFVTAGLIYSKNTGSQWSSPVTISFPFRAGVPKFIADPGGSIHAFWMDAQGRMNYSQVANSNFSSSNAWSRPQILAVSAANLDAAIDTNGWLHVIYLRPLSTSDTGAGVYYRRSTDEGRTWSKPVSLFKSPYFRLVKKDNSNVSLVTLPDGKQTKLFATWDYHPRKQAFYIQSTDSGQTWNELVELNTAEQNPFNVQSFVNQNTILLIWQDGESDGSCTQYSQWSGDDGKTWVEPRKMEIPGCPQKNQFFKGANGLVFLMSTIQSQVYLLAWDGKGWSTPQPQSTLSGFQNPETRINVSYGCLQASLNEKGEVLVVGCDMAASGGDIWFTSRALEDSSTWFPPPALWVFSSSINSSESEIFSPVLIPAGQSDAHALWIQKSTTTASGSEYGIYYSNQLDGTWSRARNVLTSPGGKITQLSVSLTPEKRLVATWAGGEAGEIYYSWANSEKANNPNEWTTPGAIPLPGKKGSSPWLVVDSSGTLYIVLAIPINEKRGIYLIQSKDNGLTWSEPVQILDGVANGMEMVEQPRLLLSADDVLQVSWTYRSFDMGTRSAGIQYARSEDRGQTWSSPVTLVDQPLTWYELISADGRVTHLLWQEITAGRYRVKEQYSLDQGLTWGPKIPVTNLVTQDELTTMVPDPAGQLHLLQIGRGDFGKQSLRHWAWDGERWSNEPDAGIQAENLGPISTLAAMVSPTGLFEVIFSAADQSADIPQFHLYPLERILDLPESVGIPQGQQFQPAASPTIPSAPRPALTVTPSAIPKLADVNLADAPASPSRNAWSDAALGILLALLVVAIAFWLTIRAIRRER